MLQKSSIYKAAEIFFQEPTKQHYLIDISRKTNIAHTSIKTNLNTLLKLGIIKTTTEKRGRRLFPYYQADLENKNYKMQKKIYNYEKILSSGLTDFIDEKLTPKSIVLFGSYKRGEDIESSDVDLFVETKQHLLDLTKFEKMLKRKIQLHFKENFKEYPKELKNNIINGITFKGVLEI